MSRGMILLLALCSTLGVAGCQPAEHVPEPEVAAGCTVTYGGGTVDGSRLWTDVPHQLVADSAQVDCNFHRFAYNNFLYLVGDGGDGRPRFMSMASWAELFPASGTPSWPGGTTALDTIQIVKSNTLKLDQVESGQAGDDFELVDVANRRAEYDIRVNQAFFDYVVGHGLYTKTALAKADEEFTQGAPAGGIWLPPGSDSEAGALEIKTSWRAFGSDAGACPDELMHCEQDAEGNWYGFVGMHLVQKTPTRGELVWGSFEHVANAPDCAPAGSNPIQPYPADPANPGATFNVNENLDSVKEQTGWSFFNYLTYTAAGGDGSSCSFPDDAQEPADTQQCNTDPEDGDGGFRQVDVCRTDALPPAEASCVPEGTNAQIVSCLNQSVQQSFPPGLDPKWRYYILIGTEWLKAKSVPTVGCFELSSDGPTCPEAASGTQYPGTEIPYPATYPRTGTVHLANTTMETWLQKGMAGTYGSDSTLHEAADCFHCHQSITTTWGEGDTSHIFTKIRQE